MSAFPKTPRVRSSVPSIRSEGTVKFVCDSGAPDIAITALNRGSRSAAQWAVKEPKDMPVMAAWSVSIRPANRGSAPASHRTIWSSRKLTSSGRSLAELSRSPAADAMGLPSMIVQRALPV
jgi:hypothetical protein